VVVGITILLASTAVLGLLTSLGVRRSGHGLPLSALSGLVFPITWLIWDEIDYPDYRDVDREQWEMRPWQCEESAVRGPERVLAEQDDSVSYDAVAGGEMLSGAASPPLAAVHNSEGRASVGSPLRYASRHAPRPASATRLAGKSPTHGRLARRAA
jgi:hypothetical protein